MGVLWTVWPLDGELKAWLDELGYNYPDDEARFPTGAEIKAALGRLEGYSVETTENGTGEPFEAFISKRNPDEWTHLTVLDFTGDHEPQKLGFEKGHPELMVRLLGLLTPACGPLALIADAGGGPVIVLRDGTLAGDRDVS